jgi:nucleoside-diphosphate kinase
VTDAAVERTLILIKPDGVARNLTGVILARVEAKGYRIVALQQRSADEALLAQHYAEHVGKPFYEPLVEFMLSGPVVTLVAEGERVIEGLRTLAGPTDPIAAAPGSIRGDFGTIVRENLIHASDSPESAEREIKLFFPGLA